VNTAILSPTGGSIGIGFAMSSAVATNVVAQLREFGETRRGWLGVRIQDVTPELAEGLGLAEARGALVTDVPQGPARDGGMEVGDVILTFDGQEITDTRELVRIVGERAEGQSVPVVVIRDGANETLQVTLGRRETAEGLASSTPDGQPIPPPPAEVMGMRLVPLDDAMRDSLGLAQGISGLVIEAVDPASDAAAKGLAAGDVVTEVAQQPIADVAEFQARVDTATENGQKSILLLIRRGGDPRFVGLSLQRLAPARVHWDLAPLAELGDATLEDLARGALGIQHHLTVDLVQRRHATHVRIERQLAQARRERGVRDREIELTNREFELLEYLARNQKLVVSREQLLEDVWGYDPFEQTNTIDVFISNLRRKLESGGEPRMLHTKRGAGYVLKPPA
jgi:S1-C subfamily serine protease